MADVFISYAHGDTDIAAAVVAAVPAGLVYALFRRSGKTLA
jgi:hypothetical protein